jgi:hypothetical protein
MKDAEKFIQNSSELFRTCLVFLPAIVDHSYINIMLYIYKELMVVIFQHSSILVSPYTMTFSTEFGEAASRADLLFGF